MKINDDKKMKIIIIMKCKISLKKLKVRNKKN